MVVVGLIWLRIGTGGYSREGQCHRIHGLVYLMTLSVSLDSIALRGNMIKE
jgi:hypothetical protein